MSSDSRTGSDRRLIDVVLDERNAVRRRAEIEHERASAIFDLIDDNSFSPAGDFPGPYILHVGIDGTRLVFAIHDQADAPLTQVTVPMGGLRAIIRDYFIVCDTYYQSIRNAPPHKIEAIDMGRRSLHDEGSRALQQCLTGAVEIDHATARRLFTLICVLLPRG